MNDAPFNKTADDDDAAMANGSSVTAAYREILFRNDICAPFVPPGGGSVS